MNLLKQSSMSLPEKKNGIVTTNMDKEMRETTITNGKNSEEKIESVVSI